MTAETPSSAQDESIEQAVQAAEAINGTPVSDRLKADIKAKPTSPRPPVGTRIIKPGEVDISGSAAHLEPGNPQDFKFPKRVEVIDGNQSPDSAAKRAAVKIALGQSFGEQVGAGIAQQIDFGTRVVDNRTAPASSSEDVPFGQRIGAGKATPIDMGVRGVSDRRTVTKDGEARTPDGPLKPGYPTADHATGQDKAAPEVRSDRSYDDLTYLAD
jgi:hypothetical protein